MMEKGLLIALAILEVMFGNFDGNDKDLYDVMYHYFESNSQEKTNDQA